MNTFHLAKVAYQRQTEGGHKEVTESYLLDALSFTEAEERIIRHLTPYASSGVTIKTLMPRQVEYVITMYAEGGAFWIAGISRDSITEKGLPKKTTSTLYLRAYNFEEACEIALDYCERFSADLVKVARTDILEYITRQDDHR